MTPADPFVVLSAANIRDACAHAASLQTVGRNGEAASLWRRIVAAAPASAEARFNLGATLLALEEFEAAEHALRESARLRPGAPWTRHRLGNLLQATGRWDEAEPHYRAALAEDASLWRARLDLAHLHLGRGDFGPGWTLFEARRSLGAAHIAPPPLPREWAGEPPAGASILVWPEQGFGDQIQFARFAPALAAAGADVTLVAPPELSALFATLGVRVVEKAAEMTLPEPEAWTFLLSIPQRLSVDQDGLWRGPYLTPPVDRVARWAGFAPQGAVGVVWQGRATPNPHRSLPSRELLQPLADAGATLVDLQPPPGRDFADLAAIMAQLDLVVTIDTAAAHLAGALGKPCWVLLPWFNADWRWGLGDSTPWYPATRVFRQTAHGDWAGVMAEVAAAWRARQGA